MGDRANIQVKEDNNDSGVFLYTHWAGSKLPETLQNALKKRWRWNDFQYLTRIIFDEMVGEYHGQETGYGISSRVGDGEKRVLIVNCESQTVSIGGESMPFGKFIALAPDELYKNW